MHRAELSALERDKLVAEWCELVGQSVQPEQNESQREDGRGHRRRSGESEASRQLGLSRPDVHRARKVASLSEPAQEKAHVPDLSRELYGAGSSLPPFGPGLFVGFLRIAPSEFRTLCLKAPSLTRSCGVASSPPWGSVIWSL